MNSAHSNFLQSSETLIITTMILGFLLDNYVYDIGSISLSSALRYGFAGLIIVTGIGLIVLASLHMSREQQPTAPGQPTTKLVNTGIFHYSRNPLYLGVVIAMPGIGLAFDNIWLILLTAPLILAFHYFLIKPEEKYLLEKFGDGYREYMHHVRRWI